MINLGLIGAGNIAHRHLEVISKIADFNIFGITSRTLNKAKELKNKFSIHKIYNNNQSLIEDNAIDALLVLASPENNFEISKQLIESKKIFFVEKPPALNFKDMKKLCYLAKEYDSINMVGLNRRHYSIFHKGIDLIKQNGSLLGISVEGHERFWNIQNHKNQLIKNSWLYVNSIHTIDLLRFFGGNIKESFFLNESINQENGDQFASIFKFTSGTLGSYISNWHSPEGWSVRLFGDGITVEFKPLEQGRYFDKSNQTGIIKPNKEDINCIIEKLSVIEMIILFKN